MFAKLFLFVLSCLPWARAEAEQYGAKNVGIKMSFLMVANKKGKKTRGIQGSTQ